MPIDRQYIDTLQVFYNENLSHPDSVPIFAAKEEQVIRTLQGMGYSASWDLSTKPMVNAPESHAVRVSTFTITSRDGVSATGKAFGHDIWQRFPAFCAVVIYIHCDTNN